MKKTYINLCCIAFLLGMVLILLGCQSKEEKIAEVFNLFDKEKYAEGIALYQEIEDVQDTMLLNRMAILYADGKGVEQDSVKALEFFEKSANLGNPQSMVEMGFAYDNGHGMKKDTKKAYNWYKKAAEKDWPEGMYRLGICYLEGFGVNKDPDKGIELLKSAGFTIESVLKSEVLINGEYKDIYRLCIFNPDKSK